MSSSTATSTKTKSQQRQSPEVQALYRLLETDARVLEIDTEVYIFRGKEHHRLAKNVYKALYTKGWIERSREYTGSGITEFATTRRAHESADFIARMRSGYKQLELPDISREPAPAAVQQPLMLDDSPAAEAQEEQAEPSVQPEREEPNQEREPAEPEHAQPDQEEEPAEEPTPGPAADQDDQEREPEPTSTASQEAEEETPAALDANARQDQDQDQTEPSAADQDASQERETEEKTSAPDPEQEEQSQEEQERAAAWLESIKVERFSARNRKRILSQRPRATHLTTYKVWLQHGYQVRKGEKAIRIAKPASSMEGGAHAPQFRPQCLFDISQCDRIADQPEPSGGEKATAAA
ncbi:hypothetical protein [Ktedonobacter racemifer]|uniref:hypothetical protein n=1 Tax=Ktedonobacter racemifer TaxID=363277 RepID=UPI0002E775CF|nr:hypothetical protein [Ktedonobacter racemifer]